MPVNQRARLVRVHNSLTTCLNIVRAAIDADYRLDALTLREIASDLTAAAAECRADIDGNELETRPKYGSNHRDRT